MVVPSPYGLVGDVYMRSLIESGWIGKLREFHVHRLTTNWPTRRRRWAGGK